MLYLRLLKVIQNMNSSSTAIPLSYVRTEFIEKLELDKDQDEFYRSAFAEIEKLVAKLEKNIEDIGAMMELRELYSELYLYTKLKAMVSVERLNAESVSRPDFRVTFKSHPIYVELKTIHSFRFEEKARQIMSEALEGKIRTEEAMANGAKFHSEWIILDALSKGATASPAYSTKHVIEEMIKKINNAIKEPQFSCGDTVLMLDFADNRFTHYLPKQSLEREHPDGHFDLNVSGELWHIAFGELNMPLKCQPTDDSNDNSDGQLERAGLLTAYPYVKGLIFHMYDRFYSAVRVQRTSRSEVHDQGSLTSDDQETASTNSARIAEFLDYISEYCKMEFYDPIE